MTTKVQGLLEHSYVWTLGLLATHQVDSGYWREWELFGMPGGIQVFVLANIALTMPFLYGALQVVRRPRLGARFGLALAVVGVAAFCIHSWFLLQGDPKFRLPASVGILVAALLTSLLLGWASLAILRGRSPQ